MNISQLAFDSEESIRDLTVEEVRKILPQISDAKKEALLSSLNAHNNVLSKKIQENNLAIEKEKQTAVIFLKRAWRNLEKSSKEDLALFFKSTSDSILHDDEIH